MVENLFIIRNHTAYLRVRLVYYMDYFVIGITEKIMNLHEKNKLKK